MKLLKQVKWLRLTDLIVTDIGEQQRFAVLKQPHKSKAQHFIGAIADKYLIAADPVKLGNCFFYG